MSIAVSANVHRSAIFTRICQAVSLFLLAMAGAIAFSPASGSDAAFFRMPVSLLAASTSAFLFFRARRPDPQIRLVVQADGRFGVVCSSPLGTVFESRRGAAGRLAERRFLIVRSITGSTLLPCLLLLRLHLEHASTITVMVFHDSVAPDEFKRLSVALHWIAGRNDPAQCETGRPK